MRMVRVPFGTVNVRHLRRLPEWGGPAGASRGHRCCFFDGESPELFAKPPVIEKVALLAAKLPEADISKWRMAAWKSDGWSCRAVARRL